MSSNPAPIDPMVMKDAQDALKIAKITMMMGKDTTFYTTILFSLKQTITDKCETAQTDGKELLINPKFFTDLGTNERITLLAHEALHVGLDHMHRKGDRDHQWYNIAADYVINAALVRAGYTLPAGGLYDPAYHDMSTEQVYDIIYKKNDSQKQNILGKCAGGSLNGNDVTYPENATGDPVTQDEVTSIILRAQTQARAMKQDPGSIPGEVDMELQRILNPPLPWHVIFQNFMMEFAKDDYTFKRPNKRFMPAHYLPTAHSESITDLTYAVDASGSVTDDEFCDCITKIEQVNALLNPKKVTVVSFDTKIGPVQEMTADDNPFKKLKFTGRGGTRIGPVHKWAAEHKPTVLVVFTDGEFNQTEPIDKSIPIIWLIYNDKDWKAKCGNKVVHYDIN